MINTHIISVFGNFCFYLIGNIGKKQVAEAEVITNWQRQRQTEAEVEK